MNFNVLGRLNLVYLVVTSEVLITMTVMVVVAGTVCSQLTLVANCDNCTDADKTTNKATCTACATGFTISDDNKTCMGMYSTTGRNFEQDYDMICRRVSINQSSRIFLEWPK